VVAGGRELVGVGVIVVDIINWVKDYVSIGLYW
jgi:hypothetical protein